MNAIDFDLRVRLAAFQHLDGLRQKYGEILPRSALAEGFLIDGRKINLVSPQGIFTPRCLEMPLTICTAPPSLKKKSPYDDKIGADDTIQYRYRGTDPNHRDNVVLRNAMIQKVPIIYLYGVVPGYYHPVYPVYIAGDNPANLTFTVLADERAETLPAHNLLRDGKDSVRRYITTKTQQRLHQSSFRLRVLSAYHNQCSICRLKHIELLDAAHILRDSHPEGKPIISNGLSLCKLHHAAFDRNIVGIRPDYVLEVREDILREHDGPMLKHGLQELQGGKLYTPIPVEFKPNPDYLEIRYEEFRTVG